MTTVVDGSATTTLYTDEREYTWHILRREDGSLSLYATRPDASCHFVVYDTLDRMPPSPKAQEVIRDLREMRDAINALLDIV